MAIRLAGKRFEHVLLDDRESDIQTVFFIKELTHSERRYLHGLFPDDVFAAVSEYDGEMTKGQAETLLRRYGDELAGTFTEICKRFIVEVRNILDADGNIVEMPVNEVIDSMISGDDVMELGMAVIDANRLGDEERKKS